jgi:hypothetical protein
MPEAHDLVAGMLQSRPERRLTAAECLAHPFFWSDADRLAFLADASDRLECEPEHSPLRAAFEAHAASVVSPNWEARLDAALLDNLGKHRKYDFGSAIDCLRVIRNKKHHYMDLPPEVQEFLGPMPAGFVRYFLAPERFPRLLLYTWHSLAAIVRAPTATAGLPQSVSASASASASSASAATATAAVESGGASAIVATQSAAPNHAGRATTAGAGSSSGVIQRYVDVLGEHTRARFREMLQVQHRRWWPRV